MLINHLKINDNNCLYVIKGGSPNGRLADFIERLNGLTDLPKYGILPLWWLYLFLLMPGPKQSPRVGSGDFRALSCVAEK